MSPIQKAKALIRKSLKIALYFAVCIACYVVNAFKSVSCFVKKSAVFFCKGLKTFFNKVKLFNKAIYFVQSKFEELKLDSVKFKKVKENAFVVCASLVLAICAVAAVSSCTLSVRIDYGENGVYYVKDNTEAAAVQDELNSKLIGINANEIFGTPTEKLCYVPKSKVKTAQKISEKICKTASALENAYGLYVDGEVKAITKEDGTFIENFKSLMNYENVGAGVVVGFGEKVELVNGYATKNSILSLDAVNSKFKNKEIALSLAIEKTEIYDREISFETEITYDSKKINGYSSTVKKGKNGLEAVTASVVYVNGEATANNVILAQTLIDPVSAQVVKGTAHSTTEYTPVKFSGVKYSASAQFIWPTARTSRTYISSYWGDGRGHKGMDIASPKGTDIYAAADGKVILAERDSLYGKYIIISHGNGLETLYSHCNTLNVKKGDTVKAGQKIATVGITGNATGYHLHFEVVKNGKRVNPETYLGVK